MVKYGNKTRFPLRIEVKLFYHILSDINNAEEICKDIFELIEMHKECKERDFDHEEDLKKEDLKILKEKFGNKYKMDLYRREWELFSTKEVYNLMSENNEE